MNVAASALAVAVTMLAATAIAQTQTAPGAEIDPAKFAYARALPSSNGLVSLKLDLQALAHSRGPSEDFADVRIVDRQNRQIPYLVERRGDPIMIDVPVQPIAAPKISEFTRDGVRRSFYQLTLPVDDVRRPGDGGDRGRPDRPEAAR